MTGSGYWIAFGDIHDDISRLDAIPELPGAAGVLVTGDMTLGGGIRQAARVLEPIAERCPVLLAQIGNMDRPEVTGWLEEKGWNLHARAKALFPGVMALGVGCSPFTPFGTPSEHSESQLAEWMEQALAEARDLYGPEPPALVLVSHTPPQATACDRLSSGAPVGSVAVREFIERHAPALCLCGHIHESRAEDRIGSTHVINPGTLGSGGYVILRRADAEGTGQVTSQAVATTRRGVVAELKIL